MNKPVTIQNSDIPEDVINIFIIAGEASGDHLGSDIMSSLKKLAAHNNQKIIFHGVGGENMTDQGLESLFPMEDLSVMGLAEVLPNLINIIKRIKQTSDRINEINPDVVLTIDAPDFCFRVAKKVQKSAHYKSIKFIHCVAPTVWAWRPKRAKKVARLYDGLMCLFPFEPPYFEKEGMSAVCIGHTAIESYQSQKNAHNFKRNDDKQILGLLYGSRTGEITRMAPIITDSAARFLAQSSHKYAIIAPTLGSKAYLIEPYLETLGQNYEIVTERHHKWSALSDMDIAIATSGTIGLELGIAKTPHVIAYRMSKITWHIVKRLLQTPFAHLVNVILQKEIVPECIQDDANADLIANRLLAIEGSSTKQIEAFEKVHQQLLGSDAEKPPAQQAAHYILGMIAK